MHAFSVSHNSRVPGLGLEFTEAAVKGGCAFQLWTIIISSYCYDDVKVENRKKWKTVYLAASPGVCYIHSDTQAPSPIMGAHFLTSEFDVIDCNYEFTYVNWPQNTWMDGLL